jgi:hypothetical protein
VPFAGSEAWYAADAVYFDAAPGNPPTLPLLQVWACIALGRWDDALMNWPWWQIAVALAFAVYGAMRSLDLSAACRAGRHISRGVAAACECSRRAARVTPICRSPPITRAPRSRFCASTRSATIGMPDLSRCSRSPARKSGALALAGRHARSRLHCRALSTPRRQAAMILLATIWFLLAVLAQSNLSLLGYSLHLAFDPAWPALRTSLLPARSWNLLWYGALAVIVVAWRDLASPALAPSALIVAAGATLLFVIVAFPNARAAIAGEDEHQSRFASIRPARGRIRGPRVPRDGFALRRHSGCRRNAGRLIPRRPSIPCSSFPPSRCVASIPRIMRWHCGRSPARAKASPMRAPCS